MSPTDGSAAVPPQYPRSEATASGVLTMDDGQGVYWEETGRADGVPLLYLHGGPGGGLGNRGYVTKADPERFRVIGFDQRGCGQSTPLATVPSHDLSANTTQRLIADMEALREHLGVEKWLLNGVSWGSTLALAYAQEHPERVTGIVLMAVTTTSRWEVDWITETVGAIFPEEWDRLARFVESSGVGYRRGEGRLIEAVDRLLAHPDAGVRDAVSRAWARWEDVHVSIGAGGFHPNPRWDDDQFRHDFATLVAHYWSHDGFLDPPVLDRMERLDGIPAFLIHGRRDVSGPARTAWELVTRWPGARLLVDEGDGHGGASMVDAWVAANNRFADWLGNPDADRPGPGRGWLS